MAAVVSEKGQVVIPKMIRKVLGLAPGTSIESELGQGQARLRVVRQKVSRVEDGFGMLKHRGRTVSVEELSELFAA